MITIYGKLLENIPDERNLFDNKPYSDEYIMFFRDILALIKEIIKSELNINQKKIILLFLDGRGIYDISKIMERSHGTIHQNYNLIKKKISLKLIIDDDFLKFVKQLPEYNQEKILEWIEEIRDKYKIREYFCPICKQKFNNKYQIKTHIFKINDKPHRIYYEKQLNWINKKLKKDGFSVDWIYKMEDELLFSLSWIFNLWKKKHECKSKKTIFKIFKRR